ncbi:MAG: GNAT family N-acetyltransferase [Proteobacteria bacterium]|nr:GNAT family N-acetyltransferase [Pseudomonadota bacterium]
MDFTVRAARGQDWPVLADLHVQSWRSAYRGILSDEFLHDRVEAERTKLWSARMAAWNPARSFAEIAEIDGAPCGFVCVMRDAAPEHGALLDNLHILPGHRGAGIGRRLLTDAAAWVANRFPGTPMHLSVFVANDGACAFYRRIGGIASEPFEHKLADGRVHKTLRFVWPDPGNVR